jgi:peptidoglycan/xylan/chitin deacetylase (PgdA/CDA1 family)
VRRNRFALFRLACGTDTPVRPHTILANDPDQSAFENYTVGFGYLIVTACYLTALMPWPLAVVLAPWVIQLPVYVFGLLQGRGDHQRTNSMLMMALLLAASIYFAMQSSWLRYAALVMLAVFALNAIVSHVMLIYGTLAPNCQWHGPVITRFETDAKELWLTIDDGPAHDTPRLLDMLEAHGVRATFFVVGRNDQVTQRGQTIANHSATHPAATFWCLGPGAIAREIDGGVASRWFRAPVGFHNPFVQPALAKRGMRLIGWTVRGFDATRGDCDAIVRRIVRRLEPGAIVVMHQGSEWSVRCIERVIIEAKRLGYTFVIPDDGALKTKR